VRVAAIDLGTNSTRLLVADVDGAELREVDRRTDVTRLGEGVDASGRLAPAAIERVAAAVGGYRARIEALRAARIACVATSAVRDAANAGDLGRALAARHGIAMRTIPGEEEARLTFAGATADAAAGAQVVVIDVGGGSTELVAGAPGEPPGFRVSTPLGSVRQTERHLAGDPPGAAELARLRAEARATLAAALPPEVRARTRAAIAVAGTPTSLAAIEQRLDPYDPARVHGYVLPLDACERALAVLAALPVAKRRRVTGLHPDRAPTIVAGVAILVEAMLAFELPAVRVSEADILHGLAREAAMTPSGDDTDRPV
jgi:exopolyphosphatase / guanosine-5'-triphosphate,3'-diphosphate pyrophosphatase